MDIYSLDLPFTIKKSTIHVGKYNIPFSMDPSGGAMFYGTFWCPACDAQRQLFGMPAWQSEPWMGKGCPIGSFGGRVHISKRGKMVLIYVC